YGGRVAALGIRSGRVRWSRSLHGRIYAAPAVWGGRVFVTSSTGGYIAAPSARRRRLPWAPPPRRHRRPAAGARPPAAPCPGLPRPAGRAAPLGGPPPGVGAPAGGDLGRAADRRGRRLGRLLRRRHRGPRAGQRPAPADLPPRALRARLR